MKYQHTVKYLRIAPKKLTLIGKSIKGKTVTKATDYLGVQTQKGADMLVKALRSASNNATAAGHDIAQSPVLGVMVQKGPVFMRRWIRAKGRAMPKRKPTAHVTVVIGLGKDQPDKPKH